MSEEKCPKCGNQTLTVSDLDPLTRPGVIKARCSSCYFYCHPWESPTPPTPAREVSTTELLKPTHVSSSDEEALRQQHLRWLDNPNTSRGQLEDSKTIINLLDRIAHERAKVYSLQLTINYNAEEDADLANEVLSGFSWTSRGDALGPLGFVMSVLKKVRASERSRQAARTQGLTEALGKAKYHLDRIAVADWNIDQARLAAEGGADLIRKALAEFGDETK